MKKNMLVLLAAVFTASVFVLCSSLAASDDNIQAAEPVIADTTAATTNNMPDGASVVVDVNYKIKEEDILRMDVWGEQQLSGTQMLVTPGGKVNVPYIGEMHAEGLTQSELTDLIAKTYEEKEILLEPKIQITIIAMHKPTVRVLGEVFRPGEVEYREGDRVMDAIAQAGSYKDNAWLEHAYILHKGSDIPVMINLRKMLNGGDMTQNFELKKNDTIYIPPEDYQNKIYVLGYVYRPGIYSLKENTTVMSAITLAGGPTDRGVMKSTLVIRGGPEKPERVKCDLTRVIDKADVSQDILLQPGDIVMVPETKKPDWNKISSIISTVLNLTYLRRYGF